MGLLLLGFTGTRVARADTARSRSGPTARLGTAVGFAEVGDETVTTLGGEVGLGYRFGPVALEAQLDHASMLDPGSVGEGDRVRGDLGRWGVNGRVFAPAMSWPGTRDPDSVLRLFGEIGAGRQRGEWSTGETFHRTDVSIGGGWLLDHSMEPRRALPLRSVGWLMGWQLQAARADREPGDDAVYRTTCKDCGPPMPDRDTDVALVVTCSLSASW
jgi:hypothetical protein